MISESTIETHCRERIDMFARLLSLGLLYVAALVVTASAQPAQRVERSADAAAIRAHIEGICQAFIDGDIDKIYATHTEDWRGFLESSRVPIKGIDEYMRANGFTWPRAADAPKASPNAARFFTSTRKPFG